jgi:hypothetical protein
MQFALIPNKILRIVTTRPTQLIHLNVVLSSILIVMFFLASGTPTLLEIFPRVCLSEYLFDMHCPGCGITSGLFAFFQGSFSDAIKHNYASVVVGLGICIQLLVHSLGIIKPALDSALFKISDYTENIVVGILIIVFLIQLY